MFHRRDRRTTDFESKAPPGPPPRQAATIPIRQPVTYRLPYGDEEETPFAVADNDSHLCPFDAAASFFVLYRARGTRSAGLYVWHLARKSWDRVATLDSLPADEWVGVRDADGFPLPLRLCRNGTSGTVSAIWSREVA